MHDVDPYFGPLLRRLRRERGLSLRGLAQLAHRSKSHIHELETGRKPPSLHVAQHLDRVLDADGALTGCLTPARSTRDETEAASLAHLIDTTDVGTDVLATVELAVDDLASAYATTPPGLLLDPIRQQLAQVGRLLDARTTLDQRRRLLVAGGWLSLLRATVHIDLRHRGAAAAHLSIAEQMAQQTGHREIQAWCLETVAWDVLTAGDYRRALNLSRQAQEVAPRGSSAYIQATAQEGRAWARMGDQRETRRTLGRLSRLVAPLPVPDRPEHHYQYDPAKALSYTATTLAWAGDPAAEDYARAAVAELDGTARPRRTASARLDLGLALVAAGKPDEASVTAQEAITSGRVVVSNWWRASEVVASVEATGISEARDLRDAYEAYRPLPA
ncbi:helix-turn-helix domain-containing protein [Plantactinospora sp. ZYX-F-223]|uniref:helix-turn-helix domain-containing protein n=1 Tax=Plantactinospora sp. ZYX-F-223 TaxID=3144103 RepID=UPI0031FC31D7